jgi:exodeoxyribonuclease-3
MKLLSWNVNGLRSCAEKGFTEWLKGCEGDVVGLQEVRALPQQLPYGLLNPEGFYAYYAPAERLGYSGVGLLCRKKPEEYTVSLGASVWDCEGRVQMARWDGLWVVNAYFPNGNGKDRDLSRIPYKIDFYRVLLKRVQEMERQGFKVLVMGDFNTAHQALDLARPQANEKTSGFRPEEREVFQEWMDAGYVDTFRMFCAEGGHYTWWSQRAGVRARNIGWRIDYVLASKQAREGVCGAWIHPHVKGSDHCPVGVEVLDNMCERVS